ncbi:hypothetical protein ACFSX9_15790, partial [Flavobacterium ardleyense]
MNYTYITNKLNWKLVQLCTVLLISLFSTKINGQCAIPAVGCPTTNLANYGANSNTNAATIEYDNFGSSFHSTVARNGNGDFEVWGESMSNTGTNVLSPSILNATNYPALGVAIPLKIGVGSKSVSTAQGILLATDGLYAWGNRGNVLATTLTTSTTFQKVTINGKADGLPIGVTPSDVKMMFVTHQTIAITTCSGDVWVISLDANVRGNGAAGTSLEWYQVTEDAGGNAVLNNIVATRGSAGALMALRTDGSVYVWGNSVYLGNNSPVIAVQSRAIQMTLPAGITPKMIGSGNNKANKRSFYVLATNGNLYALGSNNFRQLGDWTVTERLSWVQPRYTSAAGPVMNNVIWISPQEHDTEHNAVNIINNNKTLYSFGENNNGMLSTGGASVDPFIPTGLAMADAILAVETGGHTTMVIKQCEKNFGYVGHRIAGSMGDGTNTTSTITSFTFVTAAITICGAGDPEISVAIAPSGPTSGYCIGSSANLSTTPPGGAISIASGPASVVGDVVTFTGLGTVIIAYDLVDACGVTQSAITTLTTEFCPSDLQVVKASSTTTPIVGDNVTFTITATNNGAYDAYGVKVEDFLPTGYTIVGSPVLSTGTWSAPNWTIGNLANLANATMTITATVLATGSYANTATISGNSPDPVTSNNTSTVTPVPCAPIPMVSAVNQPTCDVATGSFTISNYDAIYTYTVTPSIGVTIVGSSVTAPEGSYFVTATFGSCSVNSAIVVINAQPATPAAPTVGTITQASCTTVTGSVELTGLPSGTWTINPGAITGNAVTTTISGLALGTTFNYTVTNSSGCTSVASANIVITNLICANDDDTSATPVNGLDGNTNLVNAYTNDT